MEKMTYVKALDAVINGEAITEEVMDKLKALRESTAKRNASDRKPTKTQVANEAIKAEILSVMADGEARTVTEIMGAVPSLADASNQKAASLVKQLTNSGALTREEVKRKAYFKIA